MKKFIFPALLVVLAGCGRYGPDYQPKLAYQPKNATKYEGDRKDCIVEANNRMDAAKPSDASGYFGLSGYLYDKAANNQDNDYHKTPMLMVDECMAQKGYKVVPK